MKPAAALLFFYAETEEEMMMMTENLRISCNLQQWLYAWEPSSSLLLLLCTGAEIAGLLLFRKPPFVC